MYNCLSKDIDMEKLRVLKDFARTKSNNGNVGNAWKLNADRVEECYFLWKTVELFKTKGFLYLLDMKQRDIAGKRRCLEEICMDAWELIKQLDNEWTHDTCQPKGCSEGYRSVDGFEKFFE